MNGRAALDKLREHEFDLPRYLQEQGLNGYRDNCSLCPIARYLLRETGATEIDVSTFRTYLAHADGSDEWISHPDHVSDFIEQFDAGEFPNLVLRS